MKTLDFERVHQNSSNFFFNLESAECPLSFEQNVRAAVAKKELKTGGQPEEFWSKFLQKNGIAAAPSLTFLMP